MGENVRLEVSGRTAWITMRRPAVLNALSKGMFRDLKAALAFAQKDPSVRYLALTGEGTAFSAGLNIKEVGAFKTLKDAKNFVYSLVRPFWRQFFDCDKPILALVNGPAYGAGAEMALASDIVVASKEATFAFSGGRVGALCCISGIVGPLIMQGRKLVEMNLTGHPISVREALQLGLVSQIALRRQLRQTAEEVIHSMEHVSPISNSSFKRIRKELITDRLLDKAHQELLRAITSPDFRRGSEAFLAKRAPVF